MALDKLFFPFASKVHPKYGVPGRSIILQGLIAVAAVLIGSFERLFIYIGFALCVFPWLTVAGLFIARRKHIGDRTAVLTRGFPVVPIFFLASSLIMMIFTFFSSPVESVTACITILMGIPCYYLWMKGINLAEKKKRGVDN